MTTTGTRQQITPELRKWIVDQAEAGHPDAAVASFRRAVAADTGKHHLRQQLRRLTSAINHAALSDERHDLVAPVEAGVPGRTGGRGVRGGHSAPHRRGLGSGSVGAAHAPSCAARSGTKLWCSRGGRS